MLNRNQSRYLYKAKRIDGGGWVQGYYVKGSDMYGKETNVIFEPDAIFYSHGETDGLAEIDPSTICQCTGLKDKNGNLIWENDVVKGAWFDKGKRHRHIGTVSYICCAYKVVGVKQYYGLHDELNGSYTVIGNIFDNTELIYE